jgi:hypothetical protein
MKKTIAQQLGVKEFPFIVRNDNGNVIYMEQESFWERWEVDLEGRELYYEDSDLFWRKTKRDDNGNRIQYECCDGFWARWKYDANGNEIYYENSDGDVRYSREPQSVPVPDPKPMTIKINGKKYKLTEI